MTKEQLDAVEKLFRDMCPIPISPGDPPAKHDLGEVIRLARLGLWARDRGIPALQDFKYNDPNGEADWALSELPERGIDAGKAGQ